MDRTGTVVAGEDVQDEYRGDGGLRLPGINGAGVRAAEGVFILFSAEGLCRRDAMALAIQTYKSYEERDARERRSVMVAAMAAKHERRLLASGQGTPAEVEQQLAGVGR